MPPPGHPPSALKTKALDLFFDSGSAYPRRRWIVDPRLQWRVTLVMMLVALGAGVVGSLGFKGIRGAIGGDSSSTAEALAGTLGNVSFDLLFFVVAIVPFVSMLFSHRIAGPLYCFRQGMDRVAEGDYTAKIRLRKQDILQRDAAIYNAMLQRLGERELMRREALLRIQGGLRATLEKIEDPDPTELPEALRMLEEAQATVEALLALPEAAAAGGPAASGA